MIYYMASPIMTLSENGARPEYIQYSTWQFEWGNIGNHVRSLDLGAARIKQTHLGLFETRFSHVFPIIDVLLSFSL